MTWVDVVFVSRADVGVEAVQGDAGKRRYEEGDDAGATKEFGWDGWRSLLVEKRLCWRSVMGRVMVGRSEKNTKTNILLHK